jgi:hypothetical protein
MKRKVIMMGLAVVAGVPHAVHARGLDMESQNQPYSSWDAAYMPHYSAEGLTRPLMDHLAVPAAQVQRSASNAWRLELAPVAPATDDPLSAKTRQVGVNFKLAF